MPLIEMRFPHRVPCDADFPGADDARTFVILRLLGVFAGVLAKAVGGRMPADQETIRYTGVYGNDPAGRPYLMREVLGGGSGGRCYADGEDTIHVVPDSRNLPTDSPRLGSRSSSNGSAWRSIQAVPVGTAAAVKKSASGRDRRPLHVDRGPVDPGLLGGIRGQSRRSFKVTIDPGGPNEREVDALADAEPVAAGEVIRIRTTGGGGWGDPLTRPPTEVLRDVQWHKVSVGGAQRLRGGDHPASR